MGGRTGQWSVYIVECSDGTLYTGLTKDLKRRIAEHNGDDKKGARYTRSRRPVTLRYCKEFDSRAAAAQQEYQIKKLSRARKIAMIE